MLAIVQSAALFGIEAQPVRVEVDVSDGGLPATILVGLPDASVRESRDRIDSAIRNSGIEFPKRKVTVNLSPADMRKVGSAFDLPIALGKLAAAELMPRDRLDRMVVVGELALDGAVRPVRGILPIAAQARRDGVERLLLPHANAGEAGIVGGLTVLPVTSLEEAVSVVAGRSEGTAAPAPRPAPARRRRGLARRGGQALARRCAGIAAAVGHNLLFIGAGRARACWRGGCGHPPALPDEPSSDDHHSVAGLLPPGPGSSSRRSGFLTHRSMFALAAGAMPGRRDQPRPQRRPAPHDCGRVRRHVLAPSTSLSRTRRPCRVPGPPHPRSPARSCSRHERTRASAATSASRPAPAAARRIEIARYRAACRDSLLDRIDLVPGPRRCVRAVDGDPPGEAVGAVRRLAAAREVQRVRNRCRAGAPVNARLQGRALSRHCALDPAGLRILDAASRRFRLSARSCHRLMKVARTIADLAGDDAIAAGHLAEAVQFRLDE